MQDVISEAATIRNILIITVALSYLFIGLHMVVAKFATTGSGGSNLFFSFFIYACIFLLGPIYAVLSSVGYGVIDSTRLIRDTFRKRRRSRGYADKAGRMKHIIVFVLVVLSSCASGGFELCGPESERAEVYE